MRRFFQAHRDEDYSQIQYLTAKCNRLSQDKAVWERDCLVARDRERSLKNDLQAVATRLRQQEQVNTDLRIQYDRLTSRLHKQQDQITFLQGQVRHLTEERSRDAVLLSLQLEQVISELLCLQSSEVQLEGLVEELQAEAQHRAEQIDSLQAELHSKTKEVEEWQSRYARQTFELQNLHSAYQRKVKELRQENEGSIKKLQETAEQFEWLCEQQRCWMSCVKRFKGSLTDEKEALSRQVDSLEKKVAVLQAELMRGSKNMCTVMPLASIQDVNNQRCSREGQSCTDAITSPLDTDTLLHLQLPEDEQKTLYGKLFGQIDCVVEEYQKPP